MIPMLLVIVICVAGLATLALLAGRIFMPASPPADRYVAVESLGPRPTPTTVTAMYEQSGATHVEIPLPRLDSDGQVKFFELTRRSGDHIRFMVVVRPDGKVVSALDTCAGCYRHDRGFSQINDHVACRKCGQAFTIDQHGDVSSSCHPVVVPHEIRDGRPVLKALDIRELHNRFMADAATNP